ncbi:melatonin receptor type 1B-B-like [Montipora foliosa]|uniref:melatonin receptor type 1B-B-like n=1 Tax=Montipora foliosa TaxID=591990 RepID=UPI0035F1F972
MAHSVLPDFHWSAAAVAILAPVVALIILFGIIGNILVIIVLWQQKRRSHRKSGSFFLISLAAADILASANLIFMLATIINKGEWIFGEPLCKLNGFLTVLLGATSLLTLCAISVNRYFKIVEGGKYDRIFSYSNTLRILAVTWFIPFVLSLAPIIGWSAHEYQVGKCVCHFLFSRNISYTLTFATLVVAIPFSIILFCYFKIYKIIKAHGTMIGNLRRDQPSVNVEDIKIATTLFTVIVVFIICYIPASVINILDMANLGFRIPHWLDMFSFVLVVSNHANNPVIYNALNRSFRQSFREVLHIGPPGQPRPASRLHSGSCSKSTIPRCLQSQGEKGEKNPNNPCYQHSTSSTEKYTPEVVEVTENLDFDQETIVPKGCLSDQSSYC